MSDQPQFFNDFQQTNRHHVVTTTDSDVLKVDHLNAVSGSANSYEVDEMEDYDSPYEHLIKNSSNLQHLAEFISKDRPVDENESLYASVFGLGLVLNLFLFLVIVFPARRIAQARSQCVFIGVLTFAHSLYCFCHLAELTFLKLHAGYWTTCIRTVQHGAIRSLWHLLVIGAALGCAVDNYIAVCHPIHHRLQNSKLTSIFLLSTSLYALFAFLTSFFDWFSSFNIEKQCMGNIFAINANESYFKNYCQALSSCDSRYVHEIVAMALWLVSAILCCYFYAKTVVCLRLSQKRLFASQPSKSSNASLNSVILMNQTVPKPQPISYQSSHRLTVQRSNSVSGELSPSPSPKSSTSSKASVVVRNNSSFCGTNSMGSKTTTTSQRSHSVSQQLILLQGRKRFSNSLIAILGIFFATWLPYVSLQLANKVLFTERFRIEVMPQFLPYLQHFHFLLALNTIVNPLIYGRSFMLMLHKKAFKAPSPSCLRPHYAPASHL